MKRYPGNTAIVGTLALFVGLGGSSAYGLGGLPDCTFCTDCPDGLTVCFPANTPVSACTDLGCGSGTETPGVCGTGTASDCPTTEAGQCDDGVNNDAWQNGLTDCDDPACATDPVCLVGVVVTVPFDLNLGDEYRLLFVTTSVTDATSADIADYNAVVAADAAAVPELDALGTTFTAVASTATVDALDNTMTDPSPAGATGVPIYLVNGFRFADDYDSLWTSEGPLVGGVVIPNGSLPFIPTSSGGSPPNAVWTGSSQLGVEHLAKGGLGDSDGDALRGTPHDGKLLFPSHRWINVNSSPVATEFPLYGMSGVLTVCIENITQGTFPATIQGALDAAVSGDVIELGACTFFEDNIVFPNGIDLTLRGAGRDLTIIDGGGGTDTNPILKMDNTGQTSATVISDLTFRNGVNTLNPGPGGVFIRSASPTVRNVRFLDNAGPGVGSGAAHVLVRGSSAPLFDRCLFTGGHDAGGAFIAQSNGTLMLLQCLAAGNTTVRSFRLDTGPHTLVNCTVGGSLVSQGTGTIDAFNTVFVGTLVANVGAVINTTRCLYTGAMGDNIDGLPTFVDEAGGDYRLAPGSLGIDAADHDAYVAAGGGAIDLNGDPRTHDDTGTPDTGSGTPAFLDMGTYEFQGTTVHGECNGDGNIDLDDYDDFAACLLGPGGGLGIDCNCFDFDHDGDVDIDDLAAFQLNFTGN